MGAAQNLKLICEKVTGHTRCFRTEAAEKHGEWKTGESAAFRAGTAQSLRLICEYDNRGTADVLGQK